MIGGTSGLPVCDGARLQLLVLDADRDQVFAQRSRVRDGVADPERSDLCLPSP
jgi:hypothetical protein